MRNARPQPLILKSCRGDRDLLITLSEFLHSAHSLKTANSQALSANLLYTGGLLTGGLKTGLRTARDGLKSAKQFVDNTIDRANAVLAANIKYALEKVKVTKGGLLHFSDLPDHWRINPHIHKGYRFSETHKDCIHSIFTFSNESVNIWSHAFGLLAIAIVAFYVFPSSEHYSKVTAADMFFISLFFLAAAKCMVCSCVWHTMSSIADVKLNSMYACVDYTGISLLIAASLMSTEHIAFRCDPVSWWLYILNTGILGVIGVGVPWHPIFNANDRSWLRIVFFKGLVLSGLIPPMLQLTYLYGWEWTASFYAPAGKSLLVYAVGAVLYAAKVPERFYPGAFDYVGWSHNIWHFAVLGGILYHLLALSEMFPKGLEIASQTCRASMI